MWSNKASIICLHFIAGLYKRHSFCQMIEIEIFFRPLWTHVFWEISYQFKYQATSTQAFQINDFYSNPGDEENENKMIWLS